MQKIAVVGKTFGRLTVTDDPKDRLVCRCVCGTVKTFYRTNVLTGKTTSCGCARVENSRKMLTTHGKYNLPECGVWAGILRRCYNPHEKSFPVYGGRGIKVAEEWRSDFSRFYADMGPRPFPKAQIDRIDTDGDYTPENCRWVTHTENARNRRDNRILEYNGKRQTMIEWSHELGINYRTISTRLNRDKRSVAEALYEEEKMKH